ncbi:MAG: hypothetical protein ACREOC_15535 [Gemmatimonadales bacterium]
MTTPAGSGYGPNRLVAELHALGHSRAAQVHAENQTFVVIPEYEVQVGRFQGRIVDLGLPAVPDFPKSVGASIHVRAEPQLLEYEHRPPQRNITKSALGTDWRYWSHNFNWAGERERSAARLMHQVNTIFDRA